MLTRARIVPLLLLVALATGGCGQPAGPAVAGIEVGQRAPDFALAALDGGEVTLADHRGSVVLLNFWATWCPPCNLEMPDIEAAYQAHHDRGLVVLGINYRESAQAVRPFVDQMGLSFPVLLDTRGQVGAEYRMLGLPMTLILDREGVIGVRHVGYLSAGQLDTYLARFDLD